MTKEEIISTLIGYLNQHVRGNHSVQQHTYKFELFRLFADGYRVGFFESERSFLEESLRNVMTERWAKGVEERRDLLDQVLAMWREWHYAWIHYGT